MKLLLVIVSLIVCLSMQAQNRADMLVAKRDSIRLEINKELDSCRVCGGDFPLSLGFVFGDDEMEIADSLGWDLGTLYTESARARLVQLLKIEYSEAELDRLVAQWVGDLRGYEPRG